MFSLSLITVQRHEREMNAVELLCMVPAQIVQ